MADTSRGRSAGRSIAGSIRKSKMASGIDDRGSLMTRKRKAKRVKIIPSSVKARAAPVVRGMRMGRASTDKRRRKDWA